MSNESLGWYSAFPFEKHNPDTPFLIDGLLGLVTKYQMDKVFDSIVALFKADWPQDLDEWDRFMATVDKRSLAQKIEDDGEAYCPRGGSRILEPVSAIQLGRKYNFPESMLTSAYYHLSRTSIVCHWNTCCEEHSDLPVTGKLGARWELLTAEEHRVLAYGRYMLEDNIGRYTGVLLAGLKEHRRGNRLFFEHKDTCKDAMASFHSTLDDKEKIRSEGLVDYFGKFERRERAELLGFCPSCAQVVADFAGRVRFGIWDDLQRFFVLPDGQLFLRFFPHTRL